MKVKSEREVTQSCPTLHDPMDCSLPGSSIHGIFQARVLEWGAIAFSTLVIRERQIKTIMRYHLTLAIIAAYFLQRKIASTGEDVEKLEISYMAGGIIKWCNYSGKQFDNFSKS